MKKSVILADNSYTIRRIVELSFSEEEDIDLISFDTGLNIKEKILEIKPSVVLVDIKLPELDGYEICRFINTTAELKDTKVFLIKGGFEPVDEGQLKDLTYVDFVTKPFDSKALVSQIKDMVSGEQAETVPTQETRIPSSLPEDIPSVDGIEDERGNIDFSDMEENLDTEKFFGDGNTQNSDSIISDDVLPSEEITQGAGSDDAEDNLSPDLSEDISNPFVGESSIEGEDNELGNEEKKIRENIKKQEEELNIGSLTMDEIDIKKEIEKREITDNSVNKEDSSESGKNIVENKTAPISIENIDDSQLENVFSPKQGKNTFEEPPLPQREETKETIPEEPEPTAHATDENSSDNQKENIERVLSEMKSTQTKDSPGHEAVVEKIESEESPFQPTGIPDKDVITKNVEDKLSKAVQEILWEIVPPLAEKLINEEIEKIDKKLDKELTPQS